jgi:acyl carrier protein
VSGHYEQKRRAATIGNGRFGTPLTKFRSLVTHRTQRANTLMALHGMIAGLMSETNRVDAQINGLRDRLIGLVKALLGPTSAISDPFPVERQLSDLGISSLKMVNLMLAVEVEFDIAIPQADITPENFHSILTIEALVARTLESR